VVDESPFFVTPLDRHHDRAAFSSGVEPLDRYLWTQATQDMQRNVAAVFVLVERTTGRLTGYYTLAATAIEPTALPAELTRRLPYYEVFPATLIGRLAVDRHYQGRKLGATLLADALRRSYENRQTVAAMAVVVDAKDEAARSFYEHHGFIPFDDRPQRLYMPMASAGRPLMR